jgi:hypothetical protein
MKQLWILLGCGVAVVVMVWILWHKPSYSYTQKSRVAVIIEPRQHKALEYVVKNVRTHLPSWPIQVFHGTKNEQFAKDCLKGIANVQFVNTGKDNFNSGTEYSQYMLGEEFWNRVKGEHVLIFQTDSIILNQSPRRIEEFLEYDYIGAPWKWDNTVGCGGFSLRKKSSSLEALHTSPPSRDAAEDTYFRNFFRDSPKHSLAPLDAALKFCVGSMYSQRPFSVHKCWGHDGLTNEELDKLTRDHPEVQTLIDLQ